MGSKSHNQNSLQHRPSQTIQTVTAYQGALPPPDMLEKFGKIDSGLPERIVRMAEMSMEKSFKELELHNREIEVHRETAMLDLENQKADIGTKQHESETRRIVVEKGAKYDFRAQMIILVMVIAVLGTTILFGMNGHSGIAYAVVCGGFATIIIAAIKGVSNKTKQ